MYHIVQLSSMSLPYMHIEYYRTPSFTSFQLYKHIVCRGQPERTWHIKKKYSRRRHFKNKTTKRMK